MQPAQAQYTCQACGHVFAGSPEIVSKQPTCPKCRTFGKLAGPGIGARKQVVKVTHPGASGGTPYRAAGGPVAPNYGAQDDGPVEVSADVAYGKRSNPKAVMNTVLLVVIGIGIVITLYFIVTTLKEDRSAIKKQEIEEVLDKKDFERAVDEAVKKSREALTRVEGAEVKETTNFDQAMIAIAQAGGDTPQWKSGLQPGSPFKAHGFIITAKDKKTGKMVTGFVMLLYYLKGEDAKAAHTELGRHLDGLKRNFSLKLNSDLWFVTYSGASHGGEVYDAVITAMNIGHPATFKQFTRRTGSTAYGD